MYVILPIINSLKPSLMVALFLISIKTFNNQKKCIRKDSLSTYCIIKGNHETMTVDLKRFTL